MKPSITISVTTLIEEIKSELRVQTGNWRKVSELLNQADVEFEFDTDEMKQIVDQTDISTSKASRSISLRTIGSSTIPEYLKRKCLDYS